MTAQAGVQVRAATADDAEAVWPLARDFATSFALEREAFNATFRAVLSRDDTLVCVAIRDAGVVGYLLASHHLTFLANGSVCWVDELMVHPGRRRRGIGAQLMTAAGRWARDQGDAHLSLATRRASDFYPRSATSSRPPSSRRLSRRPPAH